MITTELKKLDKVLGGGIKNGIITDIFGFRGTGKTQMALQISLNLLKNGKNVLFVDTTGNLSLIHISEPTRPRLSAYAVFWLKK